MKNISKQNVLSMFFATEWAMERAYFEWMTALTLELCALSTAERATRLQAVEVERGERLEYAYDARIRDGVAILPVKGPISPEMSYFTYYSGGTSLSMLARDFHAVLNDSRVNAILFKVSSPGGAVADVSPMARMIHAARGKKPMAVHVGGQCCSAAYWLAAAAGDIILDDTSQVGCLGIQVAHLDTSKADAKNGFKEIIFRSSQTPKKNLDPTTPAGGDLLQARLDALGQVFIEAVAEYRGVSVEKVNSEFGQGDVLIGQGAVDAGLADRLGSFEETLADLARHSGDTGGFNGRLVNGAVTSAEATAEGDDDELTDECCPEHPDGCPDDCTQSPTSAEDETDQPAAHAPLNTPAAALEETNEGVEQTMDDKNKNGAATGTQDEQAGGANNNVADLAQMRAQIEAAEKRAADATARVAAMETEARTNRLKTLAAGFSGGEAAHLAILEHLSTTAGEGSEVFTAYVTAQTAQAAQIKAGKLFAEVGTGGAVGADSPFGKLSAIADQIAADEKLTKAQAFAAACDRNKALYEQYVQERRG